VKAVFDYDLFEKGVFQGAISSNLSLLAALKNEG
jgi:hypothetical protein